MKIPKGATHEFVADSGRVKIFLKLKNGNLYQYNFLIGWSEFVPSISVEHTLSSHKVRKLNPSIEVFNYEDST